MPVRSTRIQVLGLLKTLKEQADGPNGQQKPYASVHDIAEALELPPSDARRVCGSLERDSLVQAVHSCLSDEEALYAITAMGESVLYKVEHGAY
ncbi:MAG: helix-turn-helix domain-containing protein [Chloroflexota bacterium]|nr:helix-turn-helix domain-containing protein [Chloroflexota bacterium]